MWSECMRSADADALDCDQERVLDKSLVMGRLAYFRVWGHPDISVICLGEDSLLGE